MHHALQISELLAEIFHFVHFEDLGAAALTCKTFLPSAREEFRYRCLQRPSSLVEAHLPSDLIETAPLRMLSAYSSTDQKPIEQIFPLAQSVVLSIKHSFSTRNNLTHLVADLGQQDPSHMDVAPPPVSTRSDESSYTSDRVQLAKPAYRQYVSIFRREPTIEDIARFRLAASQCSSLRYGGYDHKALLVIIALERLFPEVDFFPTLEEVVIEHPYTTSLLPSLDRVRKLSTPYPLLRKVQSIVVYEDHRIRPADDEEDVSISWKSIKLPEINPHRLCFMSSRLSSHEDSWRSQEMDTQTPAPSRQNIGLPQVVRGSIGPKELDFKPAQYLPQNIPLTFVAKPQSFSIPPGFWRLVRASESWVRILTLSAIPEANHWRILSLLGCLERLNLGQYTQGGHLTDNWRADRFDLSVASVQVRGHITLQNLKSLVIRRHGVSARLINVVHAVHFPQLTRLTIQDPVEQSAVENMPFVLEHIGTHMPELRYLSVDMGVAEVHDGDDVVPYPIFQKAESTSALLARTPLLEHFHIVCSPRSFIPSLENSHIPTIASLTRNVRHLYLDPLRSPHSKLALDGLLPFAQLGSKLVTLGIGLNPDSSHFAPINITPTNLFDDPFTSPSKIGTLNVGVRGIRDSLEAAEVLHAMFPSLQHLEPVD